jgi:homoserine kinase type II
VEPIELWSEFLRARGLDAAKIIPTRLFGGEINDNWRLDIPGSDHAWVLRHYRATTDADELDCELAAVDHLAAKGFPTPSPARSADGGLWEQIDGRPAALFTFVAGNHPPERDGGYGSLDLSVGIKAAVLAARMHVLLADVPLPGRRAPERDPWRYLGVFLAGDQVNEPLFDRLREPLQAVYERLAPVYRDPGDLPSGLIHNDITPPNLLFGDDGEIVALLDFDDSVQTFLGYELATLAGGFGRDAQRNADRTKIARLTAAYESVRPFTPRERQVVPDLLTVAAGADGVRVLTTWLRHGRTVDDPLESYSAGLFLELFASRT